MSHDNHRENVSLTLHSRPERKLLRKDGCTCAIDFHIQVGSAPERGEAARAPLRLALVLDRSGSMQGGKLTIAKRATLAVLDHLSTRDSAAVVAFDNEIDVVQPLALVTPTFKSQVRAALDKIEARASTALHEGWLTGCNTIVKGEDESAEGGLARCFLLTDGIANVGEIDPERIAAEAAGVRDHTHISTSTFGIGNDYNELLLGPMAVAGGGQFHHLRNPDEIVNTFVGELGELLNTAVRHVRLEVELESGLKMDLVSAHWMGAARGSIALGDLQYGDDQQHVVIRVQFPAQWSSEKRTVRARLLWLEGKGEQSSNWQELHFVYASEQDYREEVRDAEVVQVESIQEADRARREAIALNNRGDLTGAQAVLQQAASYIENQAPAAPPAAAPAFAEEISSLQGFRRQMASAPLPPSVAKEQYYQQQRRSRNKADYRSQQVENEKEEQ